MAEDGLPDRARVESVKLLYGYDQEVARWVGNQLGTSFKDEARAIGMYLDGKIIGGVVYHNYSHPNIEMAIASIDQRWCTRTILYYLFRYPFDQLECKRVTGLVDTDNHEVRRFDERLGFVHEGTLREAHPSGDAEIYGMLKSECKWLKYGQIIKEKI